MSGHKEWYSCCCRDPAWMGNKKSSILVKEKGYLLKELVDRRNLLF